MLLCLFPVLFTGQSVLVVHFTENFPPLVCVVFLLVGSKLMVYQHVRTHKLIKKYGRGSVPACVLAKLIKQCGSTP